MESLTGLMAPRWFARTTGDHRPALLSLPASLVVVQVGDTMGVHHRDVLWLPFPGRAVAVPLVGPIRVVHEGAHGLAVGADGTSVGWGPESLWVDADPRHRHGRDRTLRRVRDRWQGLHPEGPATSSTAQPFAVGQGVVWADAGWVYRRADGQRPTPVGPFAPQEQLFVGPQGALLVGSEGRWTHGATAAGTLVPLTRPLAHDGTTRFGELGGWVVGREPGADSFLRLSLVDGAVEEEVTEGVPTTHALCEVGDGTDAGEALMALDPAWDAGAMAGPGGRLWPLLPLPHAGAELVWEGPIAAAGARWVAHDEGRLSWFDPTTGRVVSRSAVRVRDPLRAWGSEGVAAFVQEDGQVVVIDVRGPSQRLPPQPAAAGGVDPDESALGATHALDHPSGRVLWNDDGLLLFTPR